MSGEMNPVLVAGATGYLGGYVVEEFLKRGNHVRALARNPEKLNRLTRQPEEIFQGEITDPGTLRGVCQDIDVVFSSVGLTRQKDGLTFNDVDFQGNLNLLNEAMQAKVKKFIYVSVFNGPDFLHLDIVKAHEDFVSALKTSGLDYCVVRPTGYFSDMGELFAMARKGRVWLIGPGTNRMNPIHGADLAKVCADAASSDKIEINVGGPEIMSYREMAEAAFLAIGAKPKISTVPRWMMKATVLLTKILNRHQGELLAFFTNMMLSDVVAPSYGKHRLLEHYSQLGSQ